MRCDCACNLSLSKQIVQLNRRRYLGSGELGGLCRRHVSLGCSFSNWICGPGGDFDRIEEMGGRTRL